MIANTQKSLGQRMLGAVDLAIDFATLGEYGLEPLPADGSCRKRPGRQAGWEALATGRRGGCPAEQGAMTRRRSAGAHPPRPAPVSRRFG